MLTCQHIQQCQQCQHILDLVLSKMNGNKHSVTEYGHTFMYPYNLRLYFMFSWRRIFCHFVTFGHFSSYLKPSIIIFLSFFFKFISNHHNRYTLGIPINRKVLVLWTLVIVGKKHLSVWKMFVDWMLSYLYQTAWYMNLLRVKYEQTI